MTRTTSGPSIPTSSSWARACCSCLAAVAGMAWTGDSLAARRPGDQRPITPENGRHRGTSFACKLWVAVLPMASLRWVLMLAVIGPIIGCGGTIVPPASPAHPVTVYVADYGRHSTLIMPTDDGGMV